MKPTPIRWAGSSDAIDVYLLEQRSQEMFYKLTEREKEIIVWRLI